MRTIPYPDDQDETHNVIVNSDITVQYKDAICVANDTNQEMPEFHWEKRRAETPVPRDYYEDILELNEQYKKYGCNLTHSL